MANNDDAPTVTIHASGQPAVDALRAARATIGQDIDRPRWMVNVEEKAEFYADAWGLKPGQVKVALHDIFSMLALADVGPYVESRARSEIDRLAMVLMDEFGGPTMSEGAVDMALRLLHEGTGR